MDSLCRIVLADDHKLLMEGVRSLLAPYPELRVEGMAADGEEAVALTASLAPHLLIMDLSMPRMDGVEAARAAREVSPRTRIIIYTGHEDGRRLPELVHAGVMAVVRKSAPPRALLDAIACVRRGETFLEACDPGGIMAGMLRRNARGEEGREHGPDLSVLSPREKEIFRRLAEGDSVRGIADALSISPKTVESHKYNLLTKLKASSVGDLIKIAIRCGVLKL